MRMLLRRVACALRGSLRVHARLPPFRALTRMQMALFFPLILCVPVYRYGFLRGLGSSRAF